MNDGDGKPKGEGPPASPSKRKKKKKEKAIDYFKEDQNMTEAQKKEKIRQIHAKRFLSFPTNSGISGHVFKTKELYISNQASKETKFQEEIDNQARQCTDVRNFMIGPVFGTQNAEVPCAIIQFINKKIDANDKTQEKDITPADEQKFKQMQTLLGMCVENTNEISSTINTSFSVQDVMKEIQRMQDQENAQDHIQEYEQLFSEFRVNKDALMHNIEQLERIRKTKI